VPLDEATDASSKSSPRIPEREREILIAARSFTKKIVPSAIRRGGHPHRRAGPAEIRPLSAEVGLLPTAHARRCSAWRHQSPTYAPRMPRMNQCWTPSASTRPSVHAHYNFPAFSQVRPASCAAQAAEIVTDCSREALLPVVRRERVPLRAFVSCRTCSPRTGRHRWVGLRILAFAHGRGVP